MENSRAALPTLPDGVAVQHAHLANGIGTLRGKLAEGAGWDVVASLLDQLIEDFEGHFTYEETLMENGGYAGLAAHRQEHAAFASRVRAMRAQCDNRQTELMGVLAELLHAWFVEHEGNADRRAAEYLNLEEW